MFGKHFFLRVYSVTFLLYLLVPLGVMAAAAFNDSAFPSPMPRSARALSVGV